jgi:hypothetical protein
MDPKCATTEDLDDQGGTAVKKVLSLVMLLAGVAVAALGVHGVQLARNGQSDISSALSAQHITTPADARIPNVEVHDAETARAMSDWVNATMSKATGGRSFNQIGHYLTADGKDTDDPAKAAAGADGQPTPNPLRQIALEASVGTNGLSTAVVAYKLADVSADLALLVAVLGAVLAVAGVALSGVRVPVLARRTQAAEATQAAQA